MIERVGWNKRRGSRDVGYRLPRRAVPTEWRVDAALANSPELVVAWIRWNVKCSLVPAYAYGARSGGVRTKLHQMPIGVIDINLDNTIRSLPWADNDL